MRDTHSLPRAFHVQWPLLPAHPWRGSEATPPHARCSPWSWHAIPCPSAKKRHTAAAASSGRIVWAPAWNLEGAGADGTGAPPRPCSDSTRKEKDIVGHEKKYKGAPCLMRAASGGPIKQGLGSPGLAMDSDDIISQRIEMEMESVVDDEEEARVLRAERKRKRKAEKKALAER